MLIQVQTKARKHYPSVATKYSVDLERNKSIKIFVNGVQTNSFNIGDTAEYDSYNLIYTGRITKITDKLVQITAYPGTQNERKHNLNLNTFCWRNEKFDAEQVAKHNQEESYYI
jgi:lysine/ornithine N-monooxygenase